MRQQSMASISGVTSARGRRAAGSLEGTVDGSAEVDTVHPYVAGEADVVEAADGLPHLRIKHDEAKAITEGGRLR
jgi:hypothetical protein